MHRVDAKCRSSTSGYGRKHDDVKHGIQASNTYGTMMGSAMGSRLPGSRASGLSSTMQGSVAESALDTALASVGALTILDAVAGAAAPQVRELGVARKLSVLRRRRLVPCAWSASCDAPAHLCVRTHRSVCTCGAGVNARRHIQR